MVIPEDTMPPEWSPRPAADVGSTPPDRPAGTARRRLPATEVRRRMILQGLQVVRERGLSVGLDDIRLEDLIAAAGVPRSSVWRIWTTKQEYVGDLLVAAAEPDAEGLFHSPLEPETVATTRALLAAQAHRLDTPAGRRAAMEDIVRAVITQHMHVVAASRSWRTYNAILSALPAVEARTQDRLRIHLYSAERDSFLEDIAGFLAEVLGAVGLRLRRPEYTWAHLATAVSALVEGLAVRTGLPAPEQPVHLPTLDQLLTGPLPSPRHPADADASVPAGPPIPGDPGWTAASIGVVGLIDAFCEDGGAPGASLPTG